MNRRGILTAGSRGSARELFEAPLCSATQPQRFDPLGVLRLVLRKQPRSPHRASRITFHV